jgi:hypothetical protein
MNKPEENKLSMYDAVLNLLEANAAVTGTLPAFAQAETEFQTVVGNIKAKETQLNEAVAGVTNSKHNAENEMIEDVLKAANALFVFAKRQNDEELKAISDINHSKLKKLRDTELVGKARSITDKANTNIAALNDFGITPEFVTALTEKTDAYESSLGNQAAGFAGKSAARQSLSELFTNADSILKDELDNMVELLKESNGDFYNTYKSARSIKDLGMRHESGEEEPVTPEPPPSN